jgi:hypothetical protein
MKKLPLILPFIILLCFIFGCKKQEQVERIMEDGVEVVVNHVEPYKLRGEPGNLILEKVLSIDTERDDIANLGLTEIGAFDVDSEGNIFVVCPKAKDNMIFKFDSKGNYVHSFFRRGQGPDEMPYPPLTIFITNQDEITVTDATKKKLLFFNNGGILIDAIPINVQARIVDAIPMKNGNYLCLRLVQDPSPDYLIQYILGLYDSEFKKLKDLDKLSEPNYLQGKKRQGVFTFCYSIARDKIFVGNDSRGYEIWVFDLDGRLLRKISKKYEKMPIPREFKEEKIKSLNEQSRKMTIFPESFPPFQSFFTDDMGGLYVKTQKNGEDYGEYVYDIFNAEGIFFGRKSLRTFYDYMNEIYLWATVKQNHLYCKNEKESGFKELLVYKMSWE